MAFTPSSVVYTLLRGLGMFSVFQLYFCVRMWREVVIHIYVLFYSCVEYLLKHFTVTMK